MATRVTEIQVKAIMDTAVEVDDITPFLTGANLLVTEKLTSSGLEDELLAEIERWLAAQMVSLSPKSRQVSREKIGDVDVSYSGQFGKGLESTSYGQMVLALDTTGIMKDVGKRQARINVIEE